MKPSEILGYLESCQADFLEDLAALVSVDCGTQNKSGVDQMGAWTAARCTEWGWPVERFAQAQFGDFWLARLKGTGAGRVLLIGHLDTVYPDGTVAARPMRFEDGKILGPGACDMKGGLLVGLYAMRALQRAGFRDFGELVFFFNSDEEVGSPISRGISAALAQDMDAVLVLESARMNGDIVTARKGSAVFTLHVTGKAAHAGVEPEKGANAVVELAHQITALAQLNGCAPGVTVSPDVIGGGTKINVVPAEAWVKVDVRAVDEAGQQTVTQALAAVARQTSVAGCRVELSGGFHYPPMARTPAIAFLAGLARAAARDLGFDVGEAATGGGSDANVVAPLGVPVLDGLGPVGGLDHGPDEYIEAGSFAPRAALLAGLIQRSLAERERLRALRSQTT